MVGRGLRRLPRLITICVVVVVFHVMRCDAKTEVESEYIFFFIFLYERTDARGWSPGREAAGGGVVDLEERLLERRRRQGIQLLFGEHSPHLLPCRETRQQPRV